MSIIKAVAIGAVLLHSAGTAHSQAQTDTRTAWPTFDDLAKLRQIDGIAVSPDGRWVAYLQAPVYESADSMGGRGIVLLNLRDRSSRMLSLPGRPQNLRWSVRGELAFLMKSGERTGVYRYSPVQRDMKPRLVVDRDSLGGEILTFAWSPAGDAIAYLAADPRSESPKPDSAFKPARVILFRDTPGELTGPTSRLYGGDSVGTYLGVAALNGQPARVIRQKVISWIGSPAIEWLATGELAVVGISLNARLRQLFFERLTIIINPVTGDRQDISLGPEEAPRYPAWSHSGNQLAYLQNPKPSDDPHRPSIIYALRAVARAGAGSRVLFSEEADGLWDALPPLWSPDGRTLYVGRFQKGSARLFAIDLPTRRWRAITPDSLSVSHYSLANDGRHLIAAMENANQARELYRLDPVSGALTRLTHEGDTLSGFPLGRVDNVQWPSRDGRFTVHGFLLKPAGYNPRRRYPLIVMVHGGPGAFYPNAFMELRFASWTLPAQLLAAAGYLVLLPNPRGDTSYGPDYQAALNRDLAAGPFHDVDSGVSALVERGLVDSTAIGIFGNSYGAYLTAYAIGQTRRYVAAAIDDGPTNLSSLFGQEYAVGIMTMRARLGGTPWTQPERYAQQSPITYVNRVKTPVLMRYGGRSASVADAIRSSLLAQGMEFYAGLKESNVPVEFVLHPDQGHGVTDWDLYCDWAARTLAWFSRWMPRRSEH